MRPESRRALAACAALSLGVLLAEPYARLAAPYYAAIARTIAAFHPWEVTSIEVRQGKSALSAELQLQAFVRLNREQRAPSARVVGRVQVGEVVETPVVYWPLILMWPVASRRNWWLRVAVALPVFLGVEAATTAMQLILPMAQASAILAGDNDPTTGWDQWSRFLEAGGQFVIVAGAAIALCSRAKAQALPPELPPVPVAATAFP